MKKLGLIVFLLLASCATVKEENLSYSNKCAQESTEEAVMQCHWNAIFYKIRAKWWTATQGFTESDFPPFYRIKTKIMVDQEGNVIDIQLLTTSNRRNLDRSVVTGIKRSSPLPVPSEPLFTKGNFSEINYTFVNTDGDVEPIFGRKE